MPNFADVMLPTAFFNAGPAARLLAAGLRVNALRTNTLLRKDEWKELDDAVIDQAREQLVGIADLQAAGLTHPLGGLGTLISEFEKLQDMSAANVDMGAETAGEEDTVGFVLVGVPVPIVHKDFRINIRRLEASRRLGDSLDTTAAQVAARKVRDELEDILFNGEAITVGGNTIRGYTDHPDRNTGTAAGDWGTIGNVYTTVNNMVRDAELDGYFGPFGLYVARTQYAEAREVFTDGSGQSAIQRSLQNIPNLQFFKPSDRLADGAVVLVTLMRDVVDLAIAQNIVTVEWTEMGGMINRFKVMAAMVPRIKSDSAGNSGIVHYTGA